MVPGRDAQARERLARLAPRIASGPLASERSLPVLPVLADLLPTGLTRGSTVACRGRAALSSAFLVAAGASQAGMWIGAAGLASLGVQACHETGIALERLVVVLDPTRSHHDQSRASQSRVSQCSGRSDESWGQVLGALVDGFDLVLFGGGSQLRPGTARRVQTRVQSRGAVLLLVGAPGPFSCDVQVTSESVWEGLGEGHGHLRARRVDLAVDGRRIQRTRRGSIWLPDGAGDVTAVVEPAAPPPAAAIPLRRTG